MRGQGGDAQDYATPRSKKLDERSLSSNKGPNAFTQVIDPSKSHDFETTGSPERPDSKAAQMGRYRKLLSNSVQLDNKDRSRCGLRNSEASNPNQKQRGSPMSGDYASYVLFENLKGLEPVKVG